MRQKSILTVLTLLFLSCTTSTVNVRKLEGETATITLKSTAKFGIEILSVLDFQVYSKYQNKIYITPLSDVRKIYIHGYHNISISILKGVLAIPSLAIGGVVGVVALHVDQPGWSVVSFFSMAATVALFAIGDVKAGFSAPFHDIKLETLKLYCRYPQGLTEDQWRMLLKHYGQEEFMTFK